MYINTYFTLPNLSCFLSCRQLLGIASRGNNSVQIIDDCDVPEASFIQELVSFSPQKASA